MKLFLLTGSSDIMLQVWTPNVITVWEALLTVLQYGLLLIHAYAQDKRWPYLSLPLCVFSSFLSGPFICLPIEFFRACCFAHLFLQCVKSKN